MRLRKLTAVAAVALAAAAGLTACTSKVGQAAVVGGHRISDSQLLTYVTSGGPSPSVIAQAQSQGANVEPKVQALNELIQEQIFTSGLAATGGVPSASQLGAVHDQAAASFLGAQASGSQFDKQLSSQVGPFGYSSRFPVLLLHTAELQYVLVQRLKVTTLAAFVAAIDKLHIAVNVNARYGVWDAKQLALSASRSAGLPSFVKLAPTPKLSPSAVETTPAK